MQSEVLIGTKFGYDIQVSKLYTREVYNRFKETYTSSTGFGIREHTRLNNYYLVEHRKTKNDFPWLQHAFLVKAVYNEQSPEHSTFSCECMCWEHTGIKKNCVTTKAVFLL